MAYLNCQPLFPIIHHFPFFLLLTHAMYDGHDLGGVDCLLKDNGSLSCTICFCRKPDLTIAVTPFFSSWGILGIGRAAFSSELSPNEKTPNQ